MSTAFPSMTDDSFQESSAQWTPSPIQRPNVGLTLKPIEASTPTSSQDYSYDKNTPLYEQIGLDYVPSGKLKFSPADYALAALGGPNVANQIIQRRTGQITSKLKAAYDPEFNKALLSGDLDYAQKLAGEFAQFGDLSPHTAAMAQQYSTAISNKRNNIEANTALGDLALDTVNPGTRQEKFVNDLIKNKSRIDPKTFAELVKQAVPEVTLDPKFGAITKSLGEIQSQRPVNQMTTGESYTKEQQNAFAALGLNSTQVANYQNKVNDPDPVVRELARDKMNTLMQQVTGLTRRQQGFGVMSPAQALAGNQPMNTGEQLLFGSPQGQAPSQPQQAPVTQGNGQVPVQPTTVPTGQLGAFKSQSNYAQVVQTLQGIAQQYGIPAKTVDAYLHGVLPIENSTLDNSRIGRAKEVGIGQVLPSTGDLMSKAIGKKLDLNNPIDNLTAGLLYYDAQMKTSDGDPVKAAGKYNVGTQGNLQSPQAKWYMSRVGDYLAEAARANQPGAQVSQANLPQPSAPQGIVPQANTPEQKTTYPFMSDPNLTNEFKARVLGETAETDAKARATARAQLLAGKKEPNEVRWQFINGMNVLARGIEDKQELADRGFATGTYPQDKGGHGKLDYYNQFQENAQNFLQAAQELSAGLKNPDTAALYTAQLDKLFAEGVGFGKYRFAGQGLAALEPGVRHFYQAAGAVEENFERVFNILGTNSRTMGTISNTFNNAIKYPGPAVQVVLDLMRDAYNNMAKETYAASGNNPNSIQGTLNIPRSAEELGFNVGKGYSARVSEMAQPILKSIDTTVGNAQQSYLTGLNNVDNIVGQKQQQVQSAIRNAPSTLANQAAQQVPTAQQPNFPLLANIKLTQQQENDFKKTLTQEELVNPIKYQQARQRYFDALKRQQQGPISSSALKSMRTP